MATDPFPSPLLRATHVCLYMSVAEMLHLHFCYKHHNDQGRWSHSTYFMLELTHRAV